MFYLSDSSEYLSIKDAVGTIYEIYEVSAYASKKHVFAPKTEQLNLIANWKLGELYGLHTQENLELLKRGKGPYEQSRSVRLVSQGGEDAQG